MEKYPNISKEEALKSINTVILYLRQFGFDYNIVKYGGKTVDIEQFIVELKDKEKD